MKKTPKTRRGAAARTTRGKAWYDAVMMTNATDDELMHYANTHGAGCLTDEELQTARRYFNESMAAEPAAHRLTAMCHAMRAARAESVVNEWKIVREMWARARAGAS